MTPAGVLKKEEHNEKQKHSILSFLRMTEPRDETQQHHQPATDRASKKEVLGRTRIRNNIQQLMAAESKSFQTEFKVVRVSKTKDVRQHGESRRDEVPNQQTEEHTMEKHLSTDQRVNSKDWMQ